MKTKRISTSVLCLLLAGIMLLSCTSCAMQISAAELSKDYERKATETGEVSEAFKTAMADFSMTLFKGILTKDGENDLVSPLSTVICLAMIANGADGETKAQMEAAFGMDVDTDRFRSDESGHYATNRFRFSFGCTTHADLHLLPYPK